MNIAITGTGSAIPSQQVTNDAFTEHMFLDAGGKKFPQHTPKLIEKFQTITGIFERRYAPNGQRASDLAHEAAKIAIADAQIDPEQLDYIILAHNFGDISEGEIQSDQLPSLAARVKHLLRISNPKCVAYDLIFGCPGWIEGMIQQMPL